MQALLQRVSKASVKVDEKTVGRIGQGLVTFIGVGPEDVEEDAAYLADKIAGLRIFSDEEGKLNLSLQDIGGEVLVVSQFTLMATTRKGRRPSFNQAAPPEMAEPLVEKFSGFIRQAGVQVETGQFQAHMMVEIHNDGPVTISIDSQDRFKPRK
ncbi:MAG: D-aminoacyl-tRNA deacylase [Dehalococcoidia bacterium]